MSDTLYREVHNILNPLQVSADAHTPIVLAYSEHWRTYHNCSHILLMLHRSRQSDVYLSDWMRQCLEVMILYHDIYYKVGGKQGTNKMMSAKWAVDDLAAAPVSLVRLREVVNQGIKATATHTLSEVNPEYREVVSLLLDLDLWGLGQSPEIFADNTEQIWREFMPIATRKQFDAGRAAWARTFLARPIIYHTPAFMSLEAMARHNLTQLAG